MKKRANFAENTDYENISKSIVIYRTGEEIRSS